MNDNTVIETKLGYFQRQELIEQLTRRFASLNGYNIEPNLQILDAKHPQIKMWVAMAEAAIEYVSKQYESDECSED